MRLPPIRPIAIPHSALGIHGVLVTLGFLAAQASAQGGSRKDLAGILVDPSGKFLSGCDVRYLGTLVSDTTVEGRFRLGGTVSIRGRDAAAGTAPDPDGTASDLYDASGSRILPVSSRDGGRHSLAAFIFGGSAPPGGSSVPVAKLSAAWDTLAIDCADRPWMRLPIVPTSADLGRITVPGRPNILFIMSDDHAVTALGAYGGRLAGLNPTPTLDKLARQYLPAEMKKAGYATAVIGKWHLGDEPAAFDYYQVLPGQGEYMNPEYHTKGEGTWPDNRPPSSSAIPP